jgi:PelA/Pel-15E family pectate lyase
MSKPANKPVNVKTRIGRYCSSFRVRDSGRWSGLILLATLGIARAPITIHLAGDSTMAEKKADRRPETGWGEALQQYFEPNQVRVENHAKNGRSTRTFTEEGLWQQLLDRVKQGDYVFIEFGHNDEVPTKTDRYTPPDQYRSNLVRFIADVRARHATPVLLTPVSRRKFDQQGNVVDSHHEYSGIVRDVAAQQHTPFIDMDKKSALVLAEHGPDASKQLFLQLKAGEHPNYPEGIEDNTHFSPMGAGLMAALAVESIREQSLGLAKYLRSPSLESGQIGRSGMLARARIARLKESDRAAWQRYLATSDSIRRTDQQAIAAELKAAGVSKLTPAPTGTGFFLQKSMTPEWFATPAADSLANIIASYQAPNGGWSKRIDFKQVRSAGEGFTSADNALWFSTIDNSATTEQLSFLWGRLKAHNDGRLQAVYLKGVTYLLNAQFPNGCFPQVFPLAGSYHDAITFNDDATINALETLSAAAGNEAGFVQPEMRARAAAAVERGVHCTVSTQVIIEGRKTVWGAQHDPITFQPIKARAYEHPSLSGRESATVLDFLMQQKQPDAAVVAAVHAGADWFKANAIRGYSYAFKGNLTVKPGAGPLWARFYEIGTNRPIFSDRDGVIRYHLQEIGPERRYGYMWYTDEPAATLRRYERWALTHPDK